MASACLHSSWYVRSAIGTSFTGAAQASTENALTSALVSFMRRHCRMECCARKWPASWPSTNASSASSRMRSNAPVQTSIIPLGAMLALNCGTFMM